MHRPGTIAAVSASNYVERRDRNREIDMVAEATRKEDNAATAFPVGTEEPTLIQTFTIRPTDPQRHWSRRQRSTWYFLLVYHILILRARPNSLSASPDSAKSGFDDRTFAILDLLRPPVSAFQIQITVSKSVISWIMGKRGGKRGSRGRGGGGGGGWHNQGGRADYKEIPKTNVKFEKYYNELGIVTNEEYKEFWQALRRDLPNSFRFTGSKGHALAVQKRLIEHYIPQITSVKWNGEFVEPPRQVEWFPEKLAWDMTTPKTVVRKFPPFASFQKFLVSETGVGNISRQEIVSMIPPLVLDVQPGMTVLDLCAAPGSKSAQLIELVHRGEEARIRQVLHKIRQEAGRAESPDGVEVELEQFDVETQDDWSDEGRATGLLIANDNDYRRAQMLVHQVKRLNSPNMIVTCHDASQYPSIRIPSDSPTPRYLKFDRILADVPCSGDGTTRKNNGVWRDWLPGNGLGLHDLQLRILVRALQMLKVGGRIVYSTCSMNPIENEAIVASAIDRCGGAKVVRLVDSKNELPGLKRYPGLRDWKIMDKTGRIWNTWEEYQKAVEASSGNGVPVLSGGMFAPSYDDEQLRVPLEYCMRIYPHLQDTGGFFVAILEKQSEIRVGNVPSGKLKSSAPAAHTLKENVQPLENGAGSKETETAVEVDEPDTTHDDGSLTDDKITETVAHEPTTVNGHADEEESLKREYGEEEDAQPVNKRLKLEESEVESISSGAFGLSGSNGKQGERNGNSAPVRKKPSGQQFEEPYKYLPSDHPELLKIYDFYKLSPQFPRDRFMVRNATGEPVKAIYYTSSLVRDILRLNEGKGIKFVQSGVKMFMKQDAQGQDVCRWRIQMEGLPLVETWIGEERTVRLYKRDTLHKLLIEMFPKVAGGGWSELGEIGERVRDIGMGCCVLRVEVSDDENGFK